MAKYFTIGGERKIIMLTLREISVGEELTYDYKFAREDDPNVPRIPCRCGSGELSIDRTGSLLPCMVMVSATSSWHALHLHSTCGCL